MKRAVAALQLCAMATACDTEYVQTATSPPEREAGIAGAPAREAGMDAARPGCGATLASRITVTPVAVSDDVRYRRLGYNLIPEDDRIAFGIGADGAPSIAWVEAAGARVHVTALDGTIARRGADTILGATDIGGIVAQRDGAAVLVTVPDPGEPLADPNDRGTTGRAAAIVRIRGGVESARFPLTGTRSAVASTVGAARDCIGSPLNGRLEWNGDRYGAYFAVHGCQGDAHASFFGDKLAYLDDQGHALAGGWAWGCSIDEGLRLLPGATTFTPICLSEGSPAQGLNLVVEGKPSVLLAPEFSEAGYSAGSLGSIVKNADGTFAIAWSSRGVRSNGAQVTAARNAPDMAFIALDASYRMIGSVTWLTETTDVAELGVHLAPYGPDRLLATWETFGSLRCNAQTCEGRYLGTHARLMDHQGRFASPDETIAATPNELEDIRVFPGGDLGFAYVDTADRDRAAMPLPDGGAHAAPTRTLSVARVAYCASP